MGAGVVDHSSGKKANISPSIALKCFNDFADQNKNINGLFGNIQKNYIENCETVWNAPVAHNFIEKNLGSYNDFIEQFNKFFPEAYQAFIELVNSILVYNEVDEIKPDALESIVPLELTWIAATDGFDMTFDFAGFTHNNLALNVEDIRDCLTTMANAMDIIEHEALDSSFGEDLNEAMQALITSANKVVTEYTEASTTAATTADENAAALAGTSRQ